VKPVVPEPALAAVIPAYRERGRIGALVRATAPHVGRVLVVDDGSADGTAEEARHAGAEVLAHPANRGKGAALLTGFAAAQAAGCRWVVTLDADGQHDPAQISLLWARARATNADLVIGDRDLARVPMPAIRRRVNRWLSRRLSRRAGRALPDSQCGFRLLRLAALEGLTFVTRHFEFESELLLTFIRAGRRVAFVPVTVRPATRPSRIRPGRDTWRWFRWWWSGKGSHPGAQ
jgi:glycosyltransferase involved in cell wall biosynthesis